MCEDPDSFDPNGVKADYDKEASLLPVFCCSSRAYGKLQGNFRKEDQSVAYFEDIYATELPQLQDHAMELTVHARKEVCLNFLSNLIQFLNSIEFWVKTGSCPQYRGEEEKAKREEALKRELEKLEEVRMIFHPSQDHLLC